MTKQEYLNELKSKLFALDKDQVEDTIQYYSDYFDDANDDEKIINELGTPSELAETIIKKYKNKVANVEEISEEEENSNNAEEEIPPLYFSFDKTKITNLNVSLGAAVVVAIPGKVFSIETRGIAEECMVCELSQEGNLNIINNKRINFNFWSHNRKNRIVPRILLTIPEDIKLEQLKITLNAGKFTTKGTKLFCKKGIVEVGAGDLIVNNLFGGNINFRCGMGNLEMSGKVTGNSKVDCGMGCIRLNIEGNETDYSYDVKVGLGDFIMNKNKKSGVGRDESPSRKENNFSVICGMGSVAIKIS